MRDNLQWVGDDNWMTVAIAQGTCIAVTDGSYVKDLYLNIHSAAVVLECSQGRGGVWCSFPEGSWVACSYHGKLVALMAIHLILLAINEEKSGLQGYVICLNVLELWIRLSICPLQDFLQVWGPLTFSRIFL